MTVSSLTEVPSLPQVKFPTVLLKTLVNRLIVTTLPQIDFKRSELSN